MLTVIFCDCGGYHAKANCPEAWAGFNKWFDEGLKRNCPNNSCVRPRGHRGDCSPYAVDVENADRVPQRLIKRNPQPTAEEDRL